MCSNTELHAPVFRNMTQFRVEMNQNMAFPGKRKGGGGLVFKLKGSGFESQAIMGVVM